MYFQILIKENHYPNLHMGDLVICGIITCGEVNRHRKLNWDLGIPSGSPRATAEAAVRVGSSGEE